MTVYYNGGLVQQNQVIDEVWDYPNPGLDGGNDGGRGITETPGPIKLQTAGHDVR